MSEEIKDTSAGVKHPESSADSFFLGHDLSLMKAVIAKGFAKRQLRRDGLLACDNAQRIAREDESQLKDNPGVNVFLSEHQVSCEIIIHYEISPTFHSTALFVEKEGDHISRCPLFLTDYESDKKEAQQSSTLAGKFISAIDPVRQN